MSISAVEAEIKIPSGDLEALRGRLQAAGARRVSGKHEELNTLYDDEAGSLAAAGRMLRLRMTDGRSVLTWKGPARFEDRIKSREELETSVGDAGVLDRVLGSLGLRPRFRYEKRREEFELEECTVALDETPIGEFVEVEGFPHRIRAVLAALELDAGDAVVDSYPALYRRRREKNPGLPPDMLFSR